MERDPVQRKRAAIIVGGLALGLAGCLAAAALFLGTSTPGFLVVALVARSISSVATLANLRPVWSKKRLRTWGMAALVVGLLAFAAALVVRDADGASALQEFAFLGLAAVAGFCGAFLLGIFPLLWWRAGRRTAEA